jgi:hypothetical protein
MLCLYKYLWLVVFSKMAKLGDFAEHKNQRRSFKIHRTVDVDTVYAEQGG